MECVLCFTFIITCLASGLYILRKYTEGGQFTKDVRIDGKVVIITGCNTGIGKETALQLAKRGARVYMACRHYGKCEEARHEIILSSGNTNVFTMFLDLTSMESVRKFVKRFLEKEQSLHILINNAGVYASTRTVTKDGHEMTLATNHLGHFLLTNLLLDNLKSSAPSRVINVSSMVHKYGKIIKDDLHGEKTYSEGLAYCNSKLANILFSRELAKRLKGTQVTSNSLHPGIISTGLGRNNPILFTVLWMIGYLFHKTVKSGAQTTLACALDPDFENVSGGYFVDCKISQESEDAQDDETAEWLWRTSEKETGLAN